MHDDNSNMTIYLKEIHKIPLLTREEEDVIARKAVQGDEEAKNKLVSSHLKFVVNIAKKYHNQGLPLEDLINEGNIGLINAIDRYDPDRGFHFISYAVWWIRQAILKAIYEKSRMIRLPLNRTNELLQIENVKKSISTESGKDISDSEISRITGINETDVKDIQMLSKELISLDVPLNTEKDSSTICDMLSDDLNVTPDDYVINLSLTQELENLFNTLPPKEADILRMRYGIGDNNPLSLKEIGEKYGLTKERIRQVEKKALDRMRHPSRAKYLRDYIAA